MTLSRYCLIQAAVLLAIPALAQNFGSIGGSVRDQSGAVIPNAAVTATNTATGVATRVASLTDGQYLFTSLVPGTYDISVEAPGFNRYVRPAIEVHVSDKLTLDVALQVGEVRDAVTVSAEAPQLRTEDAQRGEVINNNFISNMPQLNRNPFALLSLAGNVQGSGNSVELNGVRTSAADYYIDGGMVNGDGNGCERIPLS
jgi:hypothetical protein